MSEQTKPTILLVEDVLSQAEIYASYLRVDGYTVITEETGQGALEALAQYKPDACVLDLHLPDMDGTAVLVQALSLYPTLPVIVITADDSADTAMEAMSKGAYDFILKPFPTPRLTITLEKALQHSTLSKEVFEWRQTLGQSRYHGFVGQAPSMQAVYRVIESVAASKATVFITGESGTGKEVAAQALHQASPRREKPFVAINCGAIPHSLLESQLFGHVKGSFTGAIANQIGAAKQADGGTLFLDEICDLPLDLQVKLLRFLQTSDVTPIGSQESFHVDIRLIAATNRSPIEEVKAGRFREDLYYRLHVVPIELPALRDRDDDIIALSMHFLQKHNLEEKKNFLGIAPEVLNLFRRYEWPGNVRQLENTVHRLVALNEGPTIKQNMLPDEFKGLLATDISPIASVLQPTDNDLPIVPLWQVEKNAILHALERTDQDVVKAAALLEVSPSTLYRKLQSWKTQG